MKDQDERSLLGTAFHWNAPVFALLCLALATTQANAQHRQMRAPGPSDGTTFEITATNGTPEIPFHTINNHVILSAKVNGAGPFDLVLDTGMPGPGVVLYGNAKSEALKLEFSPTMKVQVGGAGGDGEPLTAQMAMDESVEMPGLTMANTRVMVLPRMDGFAAYHDGIIGFSLFNRFAVEIDQDHGVLRLRDPKSFRPAAGAQILPIALRSNMPYVTVQVVPIDGEPLDAQVVVDLGAGHAISLNTDSSDKIRVPKLAHETVLGKGLSGSIHGQVGRIAKLSLGASELTQVLTSFPQSEHQNPRGMDSLHGNLGNGVLSRYNTTFDYAQKRMVLVPAKSIGEPFDYDMSGLRLDRAADGLLVEGILAESPAESAGILPGDLITRVNGEPITGNDLYTLREEFKNVGRAIQVTVQRSGKSIETSFTLRKLI